MTLCLCVCIYIYVNMLVGRCVDKWWLKWLRRLLIVSRGFEPQCNQAAGFGAIEQGL